MDDKLVPYLLASLTHDMKSYLSVIDAITSNLKTTYLTDEQMSMLNLLSSTKNSMCIMVNNTLSLSKLENKKLFLHKEKFNIKKLLNATFSMFTFSASKNNIILIKKINCNITTVIGDKTRFQQILLNILSNAIKFAKNGTIEFKTKTKIENNILIFSCEIKDSGIGIDEDKINKIFNKGTTYDPVDGSGLGLFITKELIELMNGTLSVISEKGEGTTFYFNVKFDLV